MTIVVQTADCVPWIAKPFSAAGEGAREEPDHSTCAFANGPSAALHASDGKRPKRPKSATRVSTVSRRAVSRPIYLQKRKPARQPSSRERAKRGRICPKSVTRVRTKGGCEEAHPVYLRKRESASHPSSRERAKRGRKAPHPTTRVRRSFQQSTCTTLHTLDTPFCHAKKLHLIYLHLRISFMIIFLKKRPRTT